MRRTTACLSFIALVATAGTAFSQEPTPEANEGHISEADGTIVMYRPRTLVGAAVGCPIRIKGIEVVELGRGKYFEMPVEAGRHILTNKTSSIEVNVEPGETRYVRCHMAAGFLAARAKLEIVGPESFEPDRDKYELPGT